MKKQLCVMAAACGLLSLASCSDDENVIIDQPVLTEGEQVILLDVQNTDVLATKSRPLYSTENKGAEEVTDVALLIFKMDPATNDGYPMTLERVIPISRWDQLSTVYNYGRQYSYKLEGTQKLKAGSSYTIIAVGQNETESDVIPPYKIVDSTDGSSIPELTESSWTDLNWNASAVNGDGFLKTVALGEGIRAGEIFSGTSVPVDLNISNDANDTGFTAEVLLKRQVAGVIGYFNQIPAYVNAGTDGNLATRKVRLVASAKNTQIDLSRSLGDQSDDATGEGKTESVVNGFTPATADVKYMASTGDDDAYIVYEIDLKDWFVPAETANGGVSPQDYWGINPVAEGTEIPTLGTNGTSWKNPLDGTNSNPRIATNAVLAGEFVIPFEKSLENNTFELQLIGNNGSEDVILRKWNVKLDAASKTANDADYIYNIYRNHLYQIGKRGGGDDPVDPGKDPDEPQPLDNTQDLTIKINDNWEIIHNMGID